MGWGEYTHVNIPVSKMRNGRSVVQEDIITTTPDWTVPFWVFIEGQLLSTGAKATPSSALVAREELLEQLRSGEQGRGSAGLCEHGHSSFSILHPWIHP